LVTWDGNLAKNLGNDELGCSTFFPALHNLVSFLFLLDGGAPFSFVEAWVCGDVFEVRLFVDRW
jgi:hypothetical protein